MTRILALIACALLSACAANTYWHVCRDGVVYAIGADGSEGMGVTDDGAPIRCPRDWWTR